MQYVRRSEQVPRPAYEVKHHPSSVNHLTIEQLLKRTKAKTFLQFLNTDFACIDK
jgi:DNA topoisomerase VI subunit B